MGATTCLKMATTNGLVMILEPIVNRKAFDTDKGLAKCAPLLARGQAGAVAETCR